jgi:hypothetical protein
MRLEILVQILNPEAKETADLDEGNFSFGHQTTQMSFSGCQVSSGLAQIEDERSILGHERTVTDRYEQSTTRV